ncbi:MAG: DNA repair protein [Marinosulfonomonas sp.]|nr:DNA repair protein [Marinosulfonomonas sp.]
MPKQSAAHWVSIQNAVQKTTLFAIALMAITMVVLSIGAAVGLLPWLEITAQVNGGEIANAGLIAQSGFTFFCLAMLFFLPANNRIMQLENTHRNFHVSMDDVAKAYVVSHEADRAGLFKIGSEFDSVRERIAHLRDHPRLATLEPSVLEIAAQMSHEARDLADIYSHERVERAKMFLKQRQQEIDTFQENIRIAHHTTGELKNWLLQVETEEGLIERQLDTLQADLFEILPELGFDLDHDETPAKDVNVVPLAAKPAE